MPSRTLIFTDGVRKLTMSENQYEMCRKSLNQRYHLHENLFKEIYPCTRGIAAREYTISISHFNELLDEYGLLMESSPTSNVDKGEKYLAEMTDYDGNTIQVDIYNMLVAKGIFCPATAHAVKKILDAGDRGSKGWDKDMDEAINSLKQAKRLRPALLKKYQEVFKCGE